MGEPIHAPGCRMPGCEGECADLLEHRPPPAAPHPSDSEEQVIVAVADTLEAAEALIFPEQAHPSDSERTPRTKAGRELFHNYRHYDDCGGGFRGHDPACDDRHDDLLGRILAIEAESEPAGLDVERLDRDLRSHFGELLSPNEYAAIRSIVRARLNYDARLSPSTGKGLPDTAKTDDKPNQDAGGIPYWPEEWHSNTPSGWWHYHADGSKWAHPEKVCES